MASKKQKAGGASGVKQPGLERENSSKKDPSSKKRRRHEFENYEQQKEDQVMID